MFDPDSDRAREVAADYAAYVVGGTHAEIGTALGQRFPVFGPTAGEMHPDHLDFARACRDETARLFPELVEEIDAQAKAAGRSADDVLWHYCLNVGAPPARASPGVAFHHLCRIVLETCTSAEQAAALLRSAPHIASYNYFVADAHEMYVVEAHPEKTAVRAPEDGVLVCTNHPMHEDMVPMTQTPILENSRRRAEFLRGGAVRIMKDAGPGSLPSLMRDHSAPVCGHTDGLATFWSALCVPRRRELSYTFGAPCRNEYQPARWPDAESSRPDGGGPLA